MECLHGRSLLGFGSRAAQSAHRRRQYFPTECIWNVSTAQPFYSLLPTRSKLGTGLGCLLCCFLDRGRSQAQGMSSSLLPSRSRSISSSRYVVIRSVAAPFCGCVKVGVWREIIDCVENILQTSYRALPLYHCPLLPDYPFLWLITAPPAVPTQIGKKHEIQKHTRPTKETRKHKRHSREKHMRHSRNNGKEITTKPRQTKGTA